MSFTLRCAGLRRWTCTEQYLNPEVLQQRIAPSARTVRPGTVRRVLAAKTVAPQTYTFARDSSYEAAQIRITAQSLEENCQKSISRALQKCYLRAENIPTTSGFLEHNGTPPRVEANTMVALMSRLVYTPRRLRRGCRQACWSPHTNIQEHQ